MKAGRRKVLQQEWNIHKQVHLKAGTLGATSKQNFESVPKANLVWVAFLSAQMSVRLWNETSQPGFITQKWLKNQSKNSLFHNLFHQNSRFGYFLRLGPTWWSWSAEVADYSARWSSAPVNQTIGLSEVNTSKLQHWSSIFCMYLLQISEVIL